MSRDSYTDPPSLLWRPVDEYNASGNAIFDLSSKSFCVYKGSFIIATLNAHYKKCPYKIDWKVGISSKGE